VYCFAKVFAPTSIQTEIFHKWERYDDVEKKWIQHARMSYSIVGGGDGGYRGYTYIQNYRDGKWRCSVETQRGQVLGRENFTVDTTNPAGNLVTKQE
jgi:hypothetical protein